MRAPAFLLSFLLVTVQDPLPEPVLVKLKRATVVIRVLSEGAPLGACSGVLLTREGDQGTVVAGVTLREFFPSGKRCDYQVVFNSDGPDVKTVEARWLGGDAGLGALSVKSPDLPAALPWAANTKVKEMAPAYVAGYPFLDSETVNSPIAVSRGRISHLKLNKAGAVLSFKVDTDVMPGGAIVDAQGELLGVASDDGSVLPSAVIDDALKGRVTEVQWTTLENREGTLRSRVSASLLDPRNQVTEVTLRWGRRDQIPDSIWEKAWGEGGPLPGELAETPLKKSDRRFNAEVVMKGEINSKVTYALQCAWVRADGKKLYGRPTVRIFQFEKNQVITGSADPGEKKPPETGKARSTEPEPGDWLADRRRRPAVEALKPEPVKASIAGEKSTPGSAQLTRLTLDAAQVEPCLAWSEGSEAVFVLETSGLIRRVSIPDLHEEARLKTWRPCSGLLRTKAGVLVFVPEAQEFWLLDEKSLAIRRRIPAPNTEAWAASPVGTLAYRTLRGSQSIEVLDLDKGETVRKWQYETSATGDVRVRRHPRSGRLRTEWAHLATTPDGAWLLVATHGCLHRLKVSGTDLVYEEAGPIFGSTGRIVVSPDSKYVSLNSDVGGHTPPDGERIDGVPTLVFRVEDLSVPVITLATKGGSGTVGFDREARKLYAADEGRLLIAFTPKGERAATFDGDPAAGRARQLLVHPSGRRLLVLNKTGLFWMELPP